MKKLLGLMLILALFALPSMAGAAIICPVEADTYILHGGINYGYPDRTCVRATNWVGAEVLFRFDLSGLAGVDPKLIKSAVFKAYTGQGSGMMAHPMAPAGSMQQAQVLALRTWDPTVHPHGLTNWTEALPGDFEHGYIDGSVSTQPPYLPNIYDPGDVGGVDPYYYEDWGLNPGTPTAMLQHDGGPGVPKGWTGDPNDLNPDGWAEVDLVDFVIGWLSGDFDNNGIRIHDLGGWSGSPDPEFKDDYEWGWYFASKDYQTGVQVGDPNFNLLPDGYAPHLEVNLVPIPGTVLLLGSGLLGLLGIRRKRRS